MIAGYVMLGLDHAHIMEFIAHIDPTSTRPLAAVLPSQNNFAYMVAPDGGTTGDIRHFNIAGLDRETGEPVPFFESLDTAFNRPANLSQMEFLSPIFPEIVSRARLRSRDYVLQYEVFGERRSLAYAVIPYNTGPVYDNYFGVIIVQANYDNLNVEAELVSRQFESVTIEPIEVQPIEVEPIELAVIESDVNLTDFQGQIGTTVVLLLALIAGVSVFAAQAVVAPIRAVTQYSEIMEARGLTDEEVSELQNRRGNSEIAQLARTFGSMAETVRTREQQIADLLEQTDEALARRVRELSTLEDLGRELTSTLDLNKVLEVAASALYERTEAQWVEMVIFPETEDDMSGTAPRKVTRGKSPDTRDTITEPVRLPIQLEDQTIGQLILVARSLQAGRSEQSFARQLASWVSVAVRNARLFDYIQKQQVELEITNREVMEANRLKSEFLANVSHELRTPLNAIIGFSDMLLIGMSGDLTEKQTHRINRIRDNGKRLLALVNDILDLARIEAGRIEVIHELFNPHELIERTTSQIISLAEKKHLEFVTDIQGDLPARLIGDEQRIEQILTNLLSNAVKFTETGRVELNVMVQPADRTWLLTVQDTGIGIPPHAIDYIFDEFRQVDGSTTRAYQGTGLGLAITRNLVRLMDGKITVKSTMGEGTIFTVTLPLIIPGQFRTGDALPEGKS